MFENEDFEFPRKWLDKKQYVRLDPKTGEEQLVSVEPHVTDANEFIPDVVQVTVDNDTQMLMGRGDVEVYLVETGCVPIEIVAKWKHRIEN